MNVCAIALYTLTFVQLHYTSLGFVQLHYDALTEGRVNEDYKPTRLSNSGSGVGYRDPTTPATAT